MRLAAVWRRSGRESVAALRTLPRQLDYPPIDHICAWPGDGHALESTVQDWTNTTVDGTILSDHSGVLAEVHFRVAHDPIPDGHARPQHGLAAMPVTSAPASTYQPAARVVLGGVWDESVKVPEIEEPWPTAADRNWLRIQGDDAMVLFTREYDPELWETGRYLLATIAERSGRDVSAVLFRIDDARDILPHIAVKEGIPAGERFIAVLELVTLIQNQGKTPIDLPKFDDRLSCVAAFAGEAEPG